MELMWKIQSKSPNASRPPFHTAEAAAIQININENRTTLDNKEPVFLLPGLVCMNNVQISG